MNITKNYQKFLKNPFTRNSSFFKIGDTAEIVDFDAKGNRKIVKGKITAISDDTFYVTKGNKTFHASIGADRYSRNYEMLPKKSKLKNPSSNEKLQLFAAYKNRAQKKADTANKTVILAWNSLSKMYEVHFAPFRGNGIVSQVAIVHPKQNNPSDKLHYVAKYTSSPRSGAGKIAFTKKSSSLPTIRAIAYPHELAKSQMERYIGEHVAKIVKDSVKVASTTKNGKSFWNITIL